MWGQPRVFEYNKNCKEIKNGVVFQVFEPPVTGHVEYFYNKNDGHKYSIYNGAKQYFEKGHKTYLWKYGK